MESDAIKNKKQILHLLIKHGLKVNYRENPTDRSLFELALSIKQVELAIELLKQGSDWTQSLAPDQLMPQIEKLNNPELLQLAQQKKIPTKSK